VLLNDAGRVSLRDLAQVQASLGVVVQSRLASNLYLLMALAEVVTNASAHAKAIA
jgi:hypothetical protein